MCICVYDLPSSRWHRETAKAMLQFAVAVHTRPTSVTRATRINLSGFPTKGYEGTHPPWTRARARKPDIYIRFSLKSDVKKRECSTKRNLCHVDRDKIRRSERETSVLCTRIYIGFRNARNEGIKVPRKYLRIRGYVCVFFFTTK